MGKILQIDDARIRIRQVIYGEIAEKLDDIIFQGGDDLFWTDTSPVVGVQCSESGHEIKIKSPRQYLSTINASLMVFFEMGYSEENPSTSFQRIEDYLDTVARRIRPIIERSDELWSLIRNMAPTETHVELPMADMPTAKVKANLRMNYQIEYLCVADDAADETGKLYDGISIQTRDEQ